MSTHRHSIAKYLATSSIFALANGIVPSSAGAQSLLNTGFLQAPSSVAILPIAMTATSMSTIGNDIDIEEEDDLTSFSLEDLMNVEVTTVSKRAENANDAAAAVFVLTRSDIDRSGAVTVPDALRLVPGVNVAQINANSWAVTVRGFNSRFANKLLVMIDGRTVFTPLFSGVNWDRQNIILEDIERIEVVRGPGATLWGANAVNGVINIITRSSKDTQGTLLKASAGNEYKSQIVARHGGEIGENGTFRVHGKYESFDNFKSALNTDVNDEWTQFTAGFKAEFDLNQNDSLTISGDLNSIETGESIVIPQITAPYQSLRDEDIDRTGGNLSVRWEKDLGDRSDISVQGYIDYVENDVPQLSEERTTIDLTFQHALPLGDKHDFLWGLGYRNVSDKIREGLTSRLDPGNRSAELLSGFIQDTIQLFENFDLTLGSKFENNDYTGFEVQPSARFSWQPQKGQIYWGAVSRAVRTPSRLEDNVISTAQIIPPNVSINTTPLPMVVQLRGDTTIESEELTAYELGARFRPADNVSLDVTAFFNQYENLRGSRIGAPIMDTSTGTPRVILPLTVDELVEAETYGIEAVLDWQVMNNWRIQLNGAYIDIDGGPQINVLPNVSLQAQGLNIREPGGQDPTSSANLRSFYDISNNLKFDTTIRFVDELEDFNIDSYTALDARLSYKFTNNTEVSLTGRNLNDNKHFEFGVDPNFATTPSAVERSVFISLTQKF